MRRLNHGSGARLPVGLAGRVTGHATVEIVLKHYLRPGRKDFKKVIGKAMDLKTPADSTDDGR